MNLNRSNASLCFFEWHCPFFVFRFVLFLFFNLELTFCRIQIRVFFIRQSKVIARLLWFQSRDCYGFNLFPHWLQEFWVITLAWYRCWFNSEIQRPSETKCGIGSGLCHVFKVTEVICITLTPNWLVKTSKLPRDPSVHSCLKMVVSLRLWLAP